TGNTYRRMHKYPEALDQYRYVDTAYARSEWAAVADYQLGQIYENVAGDYDSARVAYNRGKAAGGQTTTVVLLLARADLMNRYAQYHAAIILNDSLLTAAMARKDSVPESVPAGKDSVSESGPADSVRNSAGVDSLGGRRDSGKTVQARPQRSIPIDTLHARLASAINELATLFYIGFSNQDSAIAWYDTLLTRYPNSPNTPRAWYAIAQVASARDSVNGKATADSLYRRIVKEYPATDFAVEARRLLGLPPVAHIVDPAEVTYHQAEESLLSGQFQTAVDTMLEIIQNHPKSPFASRAEFAAGWLYEEKLSLPDSALAMYRRLIKEYPSSTYSAIVRPKVEAVDAERLQEQKQAADEAKAREAAAEKAKSANASPDTSKVPVLLRGKIPEKGPQDSARMHFPAPPGADSLKSPQDIK
ncbi:MAG: tetratricopeptide repeat protein, partial [Bacteroidota bacterium]